MSSFTPKVVKNRAINTSSYGIRKVQQTVNVWQPALWHNSKLYGLNMPLCKRFGSVQSNYENRTYHIHNNWHTTNNLNEQQCNVLLAIRKPFWQQDSRLYKNDSLSKKTLISLSRSYLGMKFVGINSQQRVHLPTSTSPINPQTTRKSSYQVTQNASVRHMFISTTESKSLDVYNSKHARHNNSYSSILQAPLLLQVKASNNIENLQQVIRRCARQNINNKIGDISNTKYLFANMAYNASAMPKTTTTSAVYAQTMNRCHGYGIKNVQSAKNRQLNMNCTISKNYTVLSHTKTAHSIFAKNTRVLYANIERAIPIQVDQQTQKILPSFSVENYIPKTFVKNTTQNTISKKIPDVNFAHMPDPTRAVSHNQVPKTVRFDGGIHINIHSNATNTADVTQMSDELIRKLKKRIDEMTREDYFAEGY